MKTIDDLDAEIKTKKQVLADYEVQALIDDTYKNRVARIKQVIGWLEVQREAMSE